MPRNLVKDRLTLDGGRFYKAIDELESLEVKIGYMGDEADYEDGQSVLSVAIANEFGSGHTPPRPFMRGTVEKYSEDMHRLANTEAQKVANGVSAQEVFSKIGAFAVGKVQEHIKNGSWTPNAPSTIARKGSSQPLIDTGRMRQSVHYVIQSKNGG